MSEEITLTVIGHDGAERRMAATGWTTIDHKLSVYNGRAVAAEFAPGLWAGVLDEAHQKPGKPVRALAAARNALAAIAALGDPDGALAQARGLAEEGLTESEDYL